MTIDDIRRYIVMLNDGSGCIIQPVDDERFTYILTARHTVDTPVKGENEWIRGKVNNLIRFEKRGDVWEKIIILSDKELNVGEDYFPHPKGKDIAIIRVEKISGLDNIMGISEDDLLDDPKEYFLSGYPGSRKIVDEEEEKKKLYRNNIGVMIKEDADEGMREANIRNIPPEWELKGQSGGGILKLDGRKENILLGGILVEMAPDAAQQGDVMFYPLYNFDEIVEAEEYPNKLEKIGYKPIKAPHEVTINIEKFQDDTKELGELVNLLRTERVIFDSKDKGFDTITECNEELFRLSDITSINKAKRTVINSIGSTLYQILSRHRQEKIDEVIENVETKFLTLKFSFTKRDPLHDKFDYSAIPWEYLYPPARGNYDVPSFIAEKALIIRRIGDQPMRSPQLTDINVLFIVGQDLSLLNSKKEEEQLTKAMQLLATDLNGRKYELKINFIPIHLSLYEDQDKLAAIISLHSPNIIHVVTNSDALSQKGEEYKTITGAFKNAIELQDHKRLYLLIQQSLTPHKKGQYIAFNDCAMRFLTNTEIPAVISIPHSLSTDADVFTLKTFYENVIKSKRIGSSFFALCKKILERGSIGPPILYTNTDDFAFRTKIVQPERTIHGRTRTGSGAK